MVMSSYSGSGGGLMEEVLIISGLVGVQLTLAFYTVFLHRILDLGVDSLFLVIAGNLATAFLLLPFALVFEKKKWPRRLSPVLMIQMLSIAIGGVTGYQVLMLTGIKMTSPAIASAMPNLAPGIIFIIAACLGFEKFSVWCKYSRTKVLGTIVCLGGTIAMSFLMSPTDAPKLTTTTLQGSFILTAPGGVTISKEWILGCLYLLCAVFFLSCTTVLQAAAMLNFPAPFSLCVVTSLIGSATTALLKFTMEGKIDAGSSNFNITTIIFIVVLGGVMTSIISTFITWCVNKKGPVTVSIFSPIQTVCSAILSAVILRQIISLGCLVGMMLIFAGLYTILWAKKKEGIDDQQNIENNATKLVHDVEKPLLT
ncbi:WAT1-related protein-like isoform X1 [Iris pallida]|uniref:WAT1-related protein n=1 Tax=Iris pallida TaxID=29817 RepID=A0AAX6GCL2_IRIPA|nr:WAT1-related protein-like isoform X1 [Iris pallida]